MKTFNDFINEKVTGTETGINKDVVDLSNYIYDHMKNNKLKFEMFYISDLTKEFPFMKDWEFSKITVRINVEYTNITKFIRFGNIAAVYIKSLSKSMLNHELMHVFQASKNRELLQIDYENQTLLSQMRSFFRNSQFNIDIIKTLFYAADDREIDAYTHSFKKSSRSSKIGILVVALMLRYFNVKNYIKDTNELRQFITIFYQYYNSSIPFFDRLKINNQINNNTLEINKKEVKQFIKFINIKLNDAGRKYLTRLTNQSTESEKDLENFVILLNKAKRKIVEQNVNFIDLNRAIRLRLSDTRTFDIRDGLDGNE